MRRTFAIIYLVFTFMVATSLVTLTLMDQMSITPTMSNHHVGYFMALVGYLVFFIQGMLYADIQVEG